MIASPDHICADIQNSLMESGLYSQQVGDSDNTWRISPDPFHLSPNDAAFFQALGQYLLKFYSALNQLYFDSVKGRAPAWVADYMDRGKPADLIEYSRMKRFKSHLPGIIRPDVIVQEDGFAVTELDSVPGGFGLTTQLMNLYARDDRSIIGSAEGGIPAQFYQMLESVAGEKGCTAAIVVSDEARDYWSEMVFLGEILKKQGLPVYVVHPREILFKEEGLFVMDAGREVAIDAVYRFYELFDLKNIPKVELLMYSSKKGRVKTTPPYKPHLEEKLSFALLHHPALISWWEKALGVETFALLSHLIPNTWVLDNRPLPPHAVIPNLRIKGNLINEWRDLYSLTQKERELVIKPSGFSPEAWGSRGVVMGHDVSSEDWGKTLDRALAEFPHQPYILQEFHKGKRVEATFWNSKTQSMDSMESRVRLTPYYFVVENQASLGGILATLCPHDKKKIHGMVDAVMVPCATGLESQS
jgi:hypothetical protein